MLASIKEKAKNDPNNKRAYAYINSLQKQNKSLRQIAKELNEAGFKTSKGNKFYANSVKQLLDFFENN